MPKKVSVAVVEDMDIVREGLRALLETCPDCKVCAEASDGVEALERVARHKPDVVLMDLTMPRMDGVEAIREIKRRRPQTRILALTAHSDDGLVFSALSAGADGYLLKNAGSRELFEAIKTVMQGKTYICAGISELVVQGFLDGGKNAPSPLDQLSPRERQILKMASAGLGNESISNALCISSKTVEKHKTNLKKKLNIKSQVEFAAFCLEQGLIERG
jgi:DNA-binding NarL/FixJ family response regulator